ncbi:hypothetical protein [Bacillus sp. EAC]|uniref:hypothetical protein n=1 Tax=Bacillus sp. EAC TaxID=1978338 RepID=UPI000B448F4B|nr:hypothetical protein [Bacillus sp. EAC]
MTSNDRDQSNKHNFEYYKEKKNAYSMELSKEKGLPELIGSEKQVAWATTLRLEYINLLDEERNELPLLKATYAANGMISARHQKRISQKTAFAENLIRVLSEKMIEEKEAKVFIELRNKMKSGIVREIFYSNNIFRWIWNNAISEEITKLALSLELCTKEDLTN